MPDRQPRAFTISEEEKKNLQTFWEIYDAHFAEVSDQLREASLAHPELGPVTRTLPQLADHSEAREALRRAVFEDQWEPYLAAVRALGEHYAYAEIRLSAWFDVLPNWRSLLMNLIVEAYAHDQAKLLSALAGLSKFTEIILSAVSQAYVDAKEDTITKQRAAILELSTPVLPVREGLLIMPLIGLLDTHRAQQVTQVLLHAIRDHRAKIVVMDITGIPVVDSRVANHLIQSVDAARLMGAKVILTGLSPEVAQALVTVGVNLERVNTQSDLQSGIEEANRILRVKVIKLRDRESSADYEDIED